MLTAENIAQAKATTRYEHRANILHEHDDCIRFAYEWLDAQKKTAAPCKTARPLKHFVERWAGRYVSQSDVEVAAHMHPQIIGKYPFFNIGARLVEPNSSRLEGLTETNTQRTTYKFERDVYKAKE